MNLRTALGGLLMLALLPAGCAVVPERALDAVGVRVIGWYAGFNPTVYNVHSSTGWTGSFSRPVPAEWDFVQTVGASLEGPLQAAGYQVRKIELDPAQAEILATGGCFSSWDGNFRSDVCSPIMAEAMHRHGLDVLIWVDGFRNGSDPGTTDAAEAHLGVYSVGAERPDAMRAFANLNFRIVAGDPPLPHRAGNCFFGPPRSIDSWQSDVAGLTAAELDWLHQDLQSLIAASARMAVVRSGLIKAAEPTCPDQRMQFLDTGSSR